MHQGSAQELMQVWKQKPAALQIQSHTQYSCITAGQFTGSCIFSKTYMLMNLPGSWRKPPRKKGKWKDFLPYFPPSKFKPLPLRVWMKASSNWSGELDGSSLVIGLGLPTLFAVILKNALNKSSCCGWGVVALMVPSWHGFVLVACRVGLGTSAWCCPEPRRHLAVAGAMTSPGGTT